MKRIATICFVSTALILLAMPLSAVDVRRSAFGDDGLGLTVRLIGGEGAVLMPGRDVNITFQTDEDAFVLIYNIDSDGYVSLLYPADGIPRRSAGREVHFLPDPGTGVRWSVGDRTGIEYIHAVAVTDRSMIDADELAFLARSGSLAPEKRFRIETDPYVAFNTIDEEIVSGDGLDAMSTDVTWFYINRRVDYPRYLCARCHGHDRMSDPYEMVCPAVEIERIDYAGVEYPYPEHFVVRHLDETVDDEEYYAADLGDRLRDDEYDDADWESWDDWDDWDDVDVNLNIYYDSWHRPWHPYPRYAWWSNYWWDDWYWGWNWTVGWGGWYYDYWPYHSWYGPYHYTSWYWNDWRYGPYDWYRRHGDYRHRTIPNGRTVSKRYLTYTGTATRLRRAEAIAGSRLARVKVKERRDRTVARSTLARRTTPVGAAAARGSAVSRTGRAGTNTNRIVTRRVVHGRDAPATKRDARSPDRPQADPDSRRSNLRRTDRRQTPARRDDAVRRRSTRRSRDDSQRSRSSSTRRTQPSKRSRDTSTRRSSGDRSPSRDSRSTRRPVKRESTKKSNGRRSSARTTNPDKGIRKRIERSSGRSRKSSKSGSSATTRSSGSRSSATRSSGSRSSGSRSSSSRGGSKRRK